VVSTCISFAILGRDRELRAIAAAGIGAWRLSVSVLWMCLCLMVMALALSEFFVPVSLRSQETLMLQKFGRIVGDWSYYQRRNWIRGEDNRFFRVQSKNPQGTSLGEVIVLELAANFQLTTRVDARQITWRENRWVGSDVETRGFEDGKVLSYQHQKNAVLDWTETPERFKEVTGRPKQKNIVELYQSIDELRRRGISARSYQMEIHSRFSYPLLGIAVILIIFPLLCAPHRNRSIAGALLEAVGLVFGSYLLLAVASAAVAGGMVSPACGAWGPVGLLLMLAIVQWGRMVVGKRV